MAPIAGRLGPNPPADLKPGVGRYAIGIAFLAYLPLKRKRQIQCEKKNFRSPIAGRLGPNPPADLKPGVGRYAIGIAFLAYLPLKRKRQIQCEKKNFRS